MSSPKTVAILFGSKSTEHNISILSAKTIASLLNTEKYCVVPIYIDENGFWRDLKTSNQVLRRNILPPRVKRSEVMFLPNGSGELLLIRKSTSIFIDVVFPALHGYFGEDGIVQGVLETADVAYAGSGVLGSALGMNKVTAKRILHDAGLPIVPFIEIPRQSRKTVSFSALSEILGIPFFIKPACSGSSVGVHKIKNEIEFHKALQDAFCYDDMVLAEKYIMGREIECSIIDGDPPKASILGEIVPHHDFYSYQAKYLDPNGAKLIIPANISKSLSKTIRDIAVRTFSLLFCSGFARVDFFVDGKNIFINEINTIPGFTAISMYPKLWEASGTPPSILIDKIIRLAIENHKRKKVLIRKFPNNN